MPLLTQAQQDAIYKQRLAAKAASTKATPMAAAITPVTVKPTTIKQDLTPAAYQTYQDRLAGIGTSPKQNTILVAQKQQQEQMAAAKTPEAQQAVYEQNLQGRKSTMLEALKRNPNVAPEYINLFENKWNPMTGKIEGATEVDWAAIPDRFRRDIQAEQEIAGKYGTTGDTANQNIAAYDPEKLAGLIETVQVDPNQFTAQQLSDMGFTPERLQHLVDSGALNPQVLQGLQQLGQQAGTLGANLDATQKPTNSMMGILQEALNAKNNVSNQRLGVSDLFTQAGLSGYAVLAQSLGQRSAEMKQKYGSMANLVTATGGVMGDLYSQMADSYKASIESFDKQMARLVKIDEDAKDQENLMEKMEKQNQYDKDMAYLKYELDVKLKKLEAEINPKTTYDTPDIYKTSKNKVVVLDPKTGQYREMNDNEAKIGGAIYNKNAVAKVFGVGEVGGWCAEWVRTMSTVAPSGDSWQEKKTHIDKRDNPKAGDALLVPLSVKSDGSGYGHKSLVLDYDDSTGDIWVAESNRDGRQNRGAGKGVVTFGVYNLNELQTQYGDNFGFQNGELKQSVMDELAKTGSMQEALVDDSWKKKQGEAVGADQYLQFAFGKGIGSTLRDFQSPEDRSLPERTDAQRYVDITGDESVLVRDKKTGQPMYQQGKELEAVLAGKSPEEIDKYFTKLQKKQDEKKDSKFDEETMDEILVAAKAELERKPTGDESPPTRAGLLTDLKEVYGNEIANEIMKRL